MKVERTLGVAGMGAIGAPVARAVAAGAVPGLRLAAVAARDADKARRALGGGGSVPIIAPEDLAETADIIVEALPAAVFDTVARPAVEAGRTLVVLSVGCLLDREDLIARATETGAVIVAATGAIVGLDAIRAAAEGTIVSAVIETRKPPTGLVGAPYLAEHGIAVEDLREALCVYDGPVRDAVTAFPANVNVAAAVSLAGIGPDRTTLRLWADPGVTRNTHTVTVDADSTRFSMTIEGVPSPDNPRTGMLTPNSALATLRRLVSNFQVGT